LRRRSIDERMKWRTLEEVDYLFGGINSLSNEFRVILARAMCKIPRNIVEWAADKLLFISSSDEYFAFALSKKEWKHKTGFIFLSECLKYESEEKQAFTIAHELAHHKLKHKTPIFSNLTEEETKRQEDEADALANKWLRSDSEVRVPHSLDSPF